MKMQYYIFTFLKREIRKYFITNPQISHCKLNKKTITYVKCGVKWILCYIIVIVCLFLWSKKTAQTTNQALLICGCLILNINIKIDCDNKS